MNNTLKLSAAHTLIASNDALAQQFKRLSWMKCETIYLRLMGLGYTWDNASSTWKRLTPESINDAQITTFVDARGDDRVQIRIMCDESHASGVVEDIAMLLDLTDMRVDKISEPVRNNSGSWVRVYIQARIVK